MTKIKILRLITFLVLSTTLSIASAMTEIANKEELRLRLGNLAPSQNLSHLKIAILDNGFGGFVPNRGMLPDSAELIEGPLKYPSTSAHGLGMAQIIWAMTGNKALGPKMYLVNTNGFTNFKAAVDFVIAEKVDIVLYSQVWLFGSNFDGKGFINAAVNRATKNGVIWINAAGNLGGHVYSGKVLTSKKSFNLKNKLDENNFTLTLTWNNFGETEQECAVKDLDLEILDIRETVVSSSRLVQSGQSPDPKDPSDQRTCYARESIQVKSLERGDYKIRVNSKNSNFDSQDTFKVIITDDRPESLAFTDHTVGFEIMPPADNATVLTVGDRSSLSSVGPTADGRIKPDFIVENSKVSFTNGNLTQGSSNAAAMVAGSIAVMKSLKTDLKTHHLQKYAASLLPEYRIPTGLINPASVPQWLKRIVPAGATVRLHPITGRVIVFTKELPLSLTSISRFNLRLVQGDDIVACSEYLTTCGVYPRTQDSFIAAPLIEFRRYIIGAKTSTPGRWDVNEAISREL